jgi:inosine triphosphate pyrophosphatase
MTLYFITGNKNKLAEAQAIIPGIEQLDIDLPEIQELDSKKIIEEKLKEAMKTKKEGEFFCEDTSLEIECLNGLPGPLIKWFLQTLGNEGIWDLISRYENKKALARTMIGYTDGKDIKFFEGKVEGEIVSPSGETSFGWDPIFKPKGYDKTFQQMFGEEKNKISMRRFALEKMKDYLQSKH